MQHLCHAKGMVAIVPRTWQGSASHDPQHGDAVGWCHSLCSSLARAQLLSRADRKWLYMCRDLRGFMAARPEMMPKQRNDPPEPYLGVDTVKTYMDNVSAYMRLLRYGIGARCMKSSPCIMQTPPHDRRPL